MIPRYDQFWYFRKGSSNSFSITCFVWFFKKNNAQWNILFFNWPTFFFWLPLILEILSNICVAFVYFPCCYVINFEINHIFLIKPFYYVIKKSRQKCKRCYKTINEKPKVSTQLIKNAKRNRTNPLFHLNVTLLGKNYWPTAPQSA